MGLGCICIPVIENSRKLLRVVKDKKRNSLALVIEKTVDSRYRCVQVLL